MEASFLHFDPHTHQSRVARRVLSLFVACALVPVGVFAYFAYTQVVGELEREALERLHRESKNAGMSILERLLLLDDGLQIVLAGLPDHSPEALAHGSRALRKIARGGASKLRMLEGDLERSLSGEQRAQLAAGTSILVTTPRPREPVRLRLLRAHVVGGEESILVIDLAAEYVFAPEGRDLSDHYWVEDAEGRRLFATQRTGWEASRPIPLTQEERGTPYKVFSLEGRGESLLGAAWTLFMASRFTTIEWNILHARARSEIHRPLEEFKKLFPLVVTFSILGVTWISLVQIRRRLVPIATLVAATRRFASRRFEAVQIETQDEFQELGAAFNEMGEEIQRHLNTLATVNSIGVSLSAENQVESLMQLVVRGAISVTGADGGSLFLTRGDGSLEQTVLIFPKAPEGPPPRRPPGFAIAERCAIEGALRLVRGGCGQYALEGGEWQPLERSGYTIGALMALPLRNDRRENIGVLQLLRAVEVDGQALPFGDDALELALSIASQAAVALTKTRLVDSFRSLFEGLIQLTVRAIDEKSAHTGQHCRKVPVLAEMIADAACASSIGPLKDFHLSPEERYELHIAALLHDCGKVVTPVHVMDKATKLETIFDGIELVRLRFAILARESQLRALSEEVIQLGGDPERVGSAAPLEETLRTLVADYEFLEECNTGGEFMQAQRQERVQLLAEKHRWRDLYGEEQPLLTPNEVSNLNIARGTLNEEEREIINYHAVATIKLLEELPFPKDMQNVPRIAGSHHERMDGKGYPNRLRGDEISMQGRILGLADVFEALTAKDRPYKPGKTLSQSLGILEKMRDEGHIDAELHNLFVRERLYLRYAMDHLSPEQIDEAHQEEFERMTGPVGA